MYSHSRDGKALLSIQDDFQRMTDKTRLPTDEEIEDFIGKQAKEAWANLRQFIESQYAITPETIFYGAKYGWTVRYRKGGNTLYSLFPENGRFTVLIVLGKKKLERLSQHKKHSAPKPVR